MSTEPKQSKRYFWLRLKEDFFEEKPVKVLRSLPDGNALVVVYLKMVLISLKRNGLVIYEGIMPTYEEELALALSEDRKVVQLTIEALLRMGAVEKSDDNTLFMAAMQDCIGSESASAERVREWRARKALQCNNMVTDGNTEKEKEIEKESRDIPALTPIGSPAPSVDCNYIIALFNIICVSLPKVKALTDKRKKAIAGAGKNMHGVSFEEFFTQVESSDFLTGRNDKFKGCGFDWILKPENTVKVIEGTYDNKPGKPVMHSNANYNIEEYNRQSTEEPIIYIKKSVTGH